MVYENPSYRRNNEGYTDPRVNAVREDMISGPIANSWSDEELIGYLDEQGAETPRQAVSMITVMEMYRE